MDDIYILYACDEWKSKSSMRLVMATTNIEALEREIRNELENGYMEFGGYSGEEAVECFNRNELGFDSLTYGYVEIVEDGEIVG